MSKRLAAAVDKALADNPRLRPALPLVALLVLLLGWQELNRYRHGLVAEAAEEAQRLARIEALRGQEVWLERAEASAATLAALRARTPPARTAGLAQAAMEAELRSLLQAQASARAPQLQVEQAPGDDLPAGLVRIRATVNAALPARGAAALVARLERDTALTRIETLEIRDGNNPGLRLVVSRFFRVTEPEQQP